MPNGSEDVEVAEPAGEASAAPSKHVDLDVLRNSSGILALISQRRYDGEVTFALFREFERHGAMARTAFVPAAMGAQYLEMVRLAIERANELKGRPQSLPFPVKRSP